MRTPLNAVTGFAKLALENEEEPQKVHEYLVKIEASGKQLIALVNDVLDMSRIERGTVSSLECKPTNLEVCIRECAELFEEQARQEEKQFEVKIKLYNPVVNCDPYRI